MEFAHSDVLFCGEDGLPLEFNIQNTLEESTLKAMIEFGGGQCSLCDGIYVVNPGTKVLNVCSDKRIISSEYIYDCVKQNYLLDMNEYRLEIKEVETSDISDFGSNLIEIESSLKEDRKSSDDVDNSVDILDNNPNITGAISNHAFDFEENTNQNQFVAVMPDKPMIPVCNFEIPLESRDEIHINFNRREPKISQISTLANVVPDSFENLDESMNMGQSLLEGNQLNNYTADAILGVMVMKDNRNVISNVRSSPIKAVAVSSSQSNALDEFDNMILQKSQEKPVEKDDECLSQSYTVSSSADAQVSPKAPSHHTSAEIFEGSSITPDSASQTAERQLYINNIEKEIEQILKKPSPKSIQDKIILVKYICCVKKLDPPIVLKLLQNI